jgi:hypothetical protein
MSTDLSAQNILYRNTDARTTNHEIFGDTRAEP